MHRTYQLALTLLLAMDLDTFDVMWKLSEPGNPAEELFLRIKQTEYFCDKKFVPPLERMPDVRLPLIKK